MAYIIVTSITLTPIDIKYVKPPITEKISSFPIIIKTEIIRPTSKGTIDIFER